MSHNHVANESLLIWSRYSIFFQLGSNSLGKFINNKVLKNLKSTLPRLLFFCLILTLEHLFVELSTTYQTKFNHGFVRFFVAYISFYFFNNILSFDYEWKSYFNCFYTWLRLKSVIAIETNLSDFAVVPFKYSVRYTQ